MSRRILSPASLALGLIIGVTAGSAPASAATVKACKNKKTGVLRVAKKCRKSEQRITFNTKGPKGDTGAPGTAGAPGTPGASGKDGANGANGQPQSAKAFNATAPASGGSAPLFTIDGITYSFQCSPFLGGSTIAVIQATGTGSLFTQETFKRPNGVASPSGDPTTGSLEDTVDADGASVVFVGTNATASGSTAQKNDTIALASSVVSGPATTTLLYSRVLASPNGCTAKGAALTVPNG